MPFVMRNRKLLIAFLMCAPLLFSREDPSMEYGKLLARVQAGDQKVDFQRLRVSYMDSWQRRQKVNVAPAKKQMMTDLFAKDFEGALKNANVVLDHNFVDIDAQYVAYLAHRELAKKPGGTEANAKLHHDKAEFHQFVMKGLLKSIVASGKGTGKDSAFVVISPEEERMLLLFLNLQALQQAVELSVGHTFDVVQVKQPENGKNATVYFNLDIPAKYDPQSIPKPEVAKAGEVVPATAPEAAADATPATASSDAAGAPPPVPAADAPPTTISPDAAAPAPPNAEAQAPAAEPATPATSPAR
jgi:hypothetical protein